MQAVDLEVRTAHTICAGPASEERKQYTAAEMEVVNLVAQQRNRNLPVSIERRNM